MEYADNVCEKVKRGRMILLRKLLEGIKTNGRKNLTIIEINTIEFTRICPGFFIMLFLFGYCFSDIL